MNSLKNLSKRARWVTAAIAVTIFLALIFNFVFKRPIANDPFMTVEQEEVNSSADETGPGLPRRLNIPSINIDVALEYVGLTPAGAMDVPKSTDEVGWFELGMRPGEIGSAVMAGHYGLYAGKPSVFDNLRDLKKGDKIYIEDDQGVTTVFVVRESRSYDPQADATDVFSSDDEKSHLNLITCEGIWNKDAKSFSKRLVVFTDKE